MPKTPNENRQSARQSDVKKPGNTSKVSGIEKVGGTTGVRFPVHDHPEHCHVSGPKGSMDK